MSTPIMEGFLYKNRKCKTSGWRKRWFALRQSGIPNHYVLEYAADKKKKVSGKIDLDQCVEVAALPPLGIKDNYRYVFEVKTSTQQYFLFASSEAEMNKWISCLSGVCGITKENQDDDDETPQGSPRQRASISTIDSSPSTRSSFSTGGQTVTLPRHDPPSWMGTLRHENTRQDPPSRTSTLRPENTRSSPRPAPLVLTSSNSTTPAQRKTGSKGDNPYIFLKDCVSRAVPSRPTSEHATDSKMWTRRSCEREPSVPDEPAPPPPQTVDDLYKRPPICEIYDSKKRWSDEKSDERFGEPPSATYDVVPSMRPNDFLSHERVSPMGPSIRISTASNGETYDQVPPLSRHAVRPLNPTLTIPRTHLRKQSLPNDIENSLPGGSLYDQVPKPRTAASSPSVTRVLPKPYAAESDAGLYDRPVQQSWNAKGSTLSIGERTFGRKRSPNSFQAGLISPREAMESVAPPSVDRNAKPSHSPGGDVVSMNRSPRIGSATTPNSIAQKPQVSGFAFPRQTPPTAVRRSTSQENLAVNGNSKTDFRLRGSEGTRTLPRRPKQQPMHCFDNVPYTDLDFCAPKSDNKTRLPKDPMTPRNVNVQVKIPPVALISQISQRSHNTSPTEYKSIDHYKTKALQMTKESVEKGEEADKEKRKVN